uniref:Cytochrome b-c1 complex subunit Rieske, mitochondrial n=1 Tax=Setaria digitata TaxID=48799 RepID=A0A915PIA6_9BILA
MTKIARTKRSEVEEHSAHKSPAFERSLDLFHQSCRLAHTDIRFPGTSDRRNNTGTKALRFEDMRRSMSRKIIFGIGGAAYLLMTAKIVQSVVYFKNMPTDQIALGTTQIDLNQIPEGQCKTFRWRGKPVFVKHRTTEEIEEARNVKLSELRDPEKDETRVQRPEWLIILAVCPHLGCIPIHGKGEYKAWFCPCHSSSFDVSGRIRVGPAPANLEVPPYKFLDDYTVVIGEE